MHDNSSRGGSTTYLVTFREERAADLAVDVPGPPCQESRAEAVRCAEARRGMGEALAWASVGAPFVAAAVPLPPRGTAPAVTE
jgi:hypothetical protein